MQEIYRLQFYLLLPEILVVTTTVVIVHIQEYFALQYVTISPSSIPKFSLIILANSAEQFVVQDALLKKYFKLVILRYFHDNLSTRYGSGTINIQLPYDMHGVIIIGSMINSHNKHRRISRWSRDDDFLGTSS